MREKRIGKKENEVKLVQKADEVNGDWLGLLNVNKLSPIAYPPIVLQT